MLYSYSRVDGVQCRLGWDGLAGIRCGGSRLLPRLSLSSILPGKIPVVSGGFPARLSVLSRSSALVPPPSKDVYTSQAERRQFFALLPAVGCAVSGSVPLEVGLVRGCSVCSRCSFFARGWVARHHERCTVCGAVFRSAGEKWRINRLDGDVSAALGRPSPGLSGDENGRGEEPPHRSREAGERSDPLTRL